MLSIHYFVPYKPVFNQIIMKLQYNRTKIVATMGPASAKKEVLLEMIKAGVNICRLNFSHGKAQDH